LRSRSEPCPTRKAVIFANAKLSRKGYERELARLHVEFVKLQQWVVHKGLKICIIFEGRDGAGKGGTISAVEDILLQPCFRNNSGPSWL
jgi:polyphosphate kinase